MELYFSQYFGVDPDVLEKYGALDISEFTTSLIKHHHWQYTQKLARKHIDKANCDTFAVPRAVFNYKTETWATKQYFLPRLGDDFVLLTPLDILTRDDTWISPSDM